MSRTRYQPKDQCISWDDHHNSVMDIFQELLNDNSLVDCTLSAEGRFLKAHKLVLSACSAYFQTLFVQENEKNPVIILKDTKFQELKAIIHFMYSGKVIVPEDQVPALTCIAETLQIKGFKKPASEELSKKEVNSRKREKSISPIPPKRKKNSSNDSEENLTIPHQEVMVVQDKDDDTIDDIIAVVDDEEVNDVDRQSISATEERNDSNTRTPSSSMALTDPLAVSLSSPSKLSPPCNLNPTQAESDDESDVKPMVEIFLPEPDFADDLDNRPQDSSATNDTNEKKKVSEQSSKERSEGNVVSDCTSSSSASIQHLQQMLQKALQCLPPEVIRQASENSSITQSIEVMTVDEIQADSAETPDEPDCIIIEEDDSVDSLKTPESTPVPNKDTVDMHQSQKENSKHCSDEEIICLEPQHHEGNQHEGTSQQKSQNWPSQGNRFETEPGITSTDLQTFSRPIIQYKGPKEKGTLNQHSRRIPGQVEAGGQCGKYPETHHQDESQRQNLQNFFVKRIAVPTDKIDTPQSLEEFLNSGVISAKNLAGLPLNRKLLLTSCNTDVASLNDILKSIAQVAEPSKAGGPSASSISNSAQSNNPTNPKSLLNTIMVPSRSGAGTCAFSRKDVTTRSAPLTISNQGVNTVTCPSSLGNVQQSNSTSIPETSVNAVNIPRIPSTTSVASTASTVSTNFASFPTTESPGSSSNSHAIKNTYEKFQCRRCPLEFTSFATLKTHVLKTHKGSFVLECPGCNPCISKNSTSIVYKCPMCLSEFLSYSFLKNHMKSHKELLNHCTRCDCVDSQSLVSVLRNQ